MSAFRWANVSNPGKTSIKVAPSSLTMGMGHSSMNSMPPPSLSATHLVARRQRGRSTASVVAGSCQSGSSQTHSSIPPRSGVIGGHRVGTAAMMPSSPYGAIVLVFGGTSSCCQTIPSGDR